MKYMLKTVITATAMLIIFSGSWIDAEDFQSNENNLIASSDEELKSEVSKRSVQDILNDYIKTALEQNLDISILRKRLETAGAERKAAKSGFFPTLSFSSRYSVAGGGREIIIDPNEFLGGLVPIKFPVTSFPFLRSHEHDTKLSVTYPLYTGGAVVGNYSAKSALEDVSKSELCAAEWNIRQEVTEAYLNYLKAIHLVNIKTKVLELSREGLKLTEVLFQQDKVLKNDIMRAQVNVSKAESEVAEAVQQKDLAKRLFNLILNRDPSEAIEEMELTYEEAIEIDDFRIKTEETLHEQISSYENMALENRAELRGLEAAIDAAESFKGIAFSEYLPKIIFALDYGWQGEEYRFTEKDDYYIASLVLNFNLFDGGAREANLEKAAAQTSELNLQRMSAQRKIGLEVEQAYLQLMTSRKKVVASKTQLESAEENYRITNRRYEAGMALPIDMNDALTQLDIARSGMIISIYDYVIAINKMKNVIGNGCRREANE